MEKLNIPENLYKQFQSGKYCDLHIQVEDLFFQAHSCVVAASSWILEAILKSSVSEDQNLSKISIQLHGVTAYAISHLLNYIYTGRFPAELYDDPAKRAEVLQAAKLYKMDRVAREFEVVDSESNSQTSFISNINAVENNSVAIANKSMQPEISIILDGSVEGEPANPDQDLPVEIVKEHVSQTVAYARSHGILYCVLCSEIFEKQEDLIAHMGEHKAESRRRPERAAAASAVASFGISDSYENDESFEDYIESAEYSISSSPTKRKRGPSKKTFACGECSVSYSSKITLIRHYNSQHPNSLYCKFCAERFEDSELLQIHIVTHTDAEELERKARMELPKIKMRGRKGKKVYTCSLCSTSFLKKKELTNHQEHIHGIVKPMHLCTVCGKEFKEKASLRSHTRVHTGEKPYACTFCGNCFADQKTWKDHERRHRGEKPFLCTTCGKSFTYRQSFTRHMKFHEGKRPFQCSICGKAFVLRQNLKEHEKRHNK